MTLLVLVGALPGLLLSIRAAYDRLDDMERTARAELVRTAHLAGEFPRQTLEGTRQLLFAVSRAVPFLLRGERDACHEHLRQVVAQSAGAYHSMGLFGVDGILICHSAQRFEATNALDRRYFNHAMKGAFSVGEFQVGRLTGLAGVNVGHPVYGEGPNPIGVVFAALDLRQFDEQAGRLALPDGGAIIITDHRGTILAQRPGTGEGLGKKLDLPGVFDTLQGSIARVAAPGGAEWLYSREDVWPTIDGGMAMHVLIGVPAESIDAVARDEFTRALGWIAAVTLAVIVLALLGAELLVMRGFHRMLAVTRRVRGGDLAARVHLQRGPVEMIWLGEALDAMAQALEHREAETRHLLERLSEQAVTDPLTGLYNRRHMDDFLHREISRAKRAPTNIALVAVDLDHFKKVNDRWGHDAGDAVLARFAALARAGVRESDLVARPGGEEFMLVLPGVNRETAFASAEAMRRSLEQAKIEFDGHALDTVTASFGIAVYPEDGTDADALLRSADAALYAAKGAGRNRVMAQAPRA